MKVLHTVYGLKSPMPLKARPCGMNNLLHLSQEKSPNKAQLRRMVILAKGWGYHTLVVFKDDTLTQTIPLV